MTGEVLTIILQQYGYVSENGKPTRKALNDGIVDQCDRSLLWNLEKVEEVLLDAGLKPERQSVNQEIDPPGDKPIFVNLGTIGSYFNVSGSQIGKWLDELNLRDEGTKMGNQEAIDRGMCRFNEMKAGPGKKTRTITMWELYLTKVALRDAGHELDFDYEKSLAAKGKNSAVTVSTIDDRVKEFAKEFVKLFNDPKTRRQTEPLVGRTPRVIIEKAEKLMKRDGFISNGDYRKSF